MKRFVVYAGVAIILFLFLVAQEDGCASEEEDTDQTPAAAATEAIEDDVDDEPTETPVPAPEPVILEGVGQTATDLITPPSSVSIAIFTHTGSSNFVVEVFGGDSAGLLINEIGPYQGSRPIFGSDSFTLDIDADGAWTLRLEAIGTAEGAPFSGAGDAASGLFDPPSSGAWEFSHDGQSNFAVLLHCADGTDLVQNEIGVVSGSGIVEFGEAPCLWEVEADGNWSLQPR